MSRPIARCPGSVSAARRLILRAQAARTSEARELRPPRRRFALLAALTLLAPGVTSGGARAQAPVVPASVLGEGALENDVFLPRSQAAERRLAEGDQAYLAARTAAPGSTGRTEASALVPVFEAWRDALVESEAGDSAGAASAEQETAHGIARFPPDPDATGARRTEAVEYAVLRRLAALEPELVAAWRRRFDGVAARDLAAARASASQGERSDLVRVERRNPATRSAVEASLVLADLDFESGDSASARQRLARARLHLAVAREPDARLASALERRAAACERALGAGRSAAIDERWKTARGLVPLASFPIAVDDPGRTSRSLRGVLPGVLLRDDGSAIVQVPDKLLVVDAAGGVRPIDLGMLAGPHGWSWMSPFNDSGGEWPLLPAGAGDSVVVVAGRSQGPRGNALLCIEPGVAGSAPKLAWGYSDRGFVGPERAADVAALLGPGLWGFEPGPLVRDRLVLVQARQWGVDATDAAHVDERESRAWCLALDLGTGEPRWMRLVATGTDARRLRADVRPTARGVASPAQPLAESDGRVLVSTELGAAALLETCDGRPCWTLESRRRAPEDDAPRCVRAPIAIARTGPGSLEGGSSAAGAPTPGAVALGLVDRGPLWLWPPADSDRIYSLHGGPLVGAERLFASVPGPRDVHEIVEAADLRSIFLSDAGGDRTALVRVGTQTGERAVVFELAREEASGQGLLLSEQRAYHATSRALHLFDRGRDFVLLERIALGSGGPGDAGGETRPGGVVVARGDRVVVVDRRAISIFEVE